VDREGKGGTKGSGGFSVKEMKKKKIRVGEKEKGGPIYLIDKNISRRKGGACANGAFKKGSKLRKGVGSKMEKKTGRKSDTQNHASH